MSSNDELFTSAEILAGFSAKRAQLLLFQIESRTAYLILQSRRTVELYLTEEAAEQKEFEKEEEENQPCQQSFPFTRIAEEQANPI